MTLHLNSREAYESIRLSDREAAVLALYVPGVCYTDDDLAALEGKSNSRETSPRITGLRDKGLVIENKHGATKNGRSVRTTQLPEPRKAFCNHTFAGHLKAVPSKRRPGYVAIVCMNHTQPVFYGYQPAGNNQ